MITERIVTDTKGRHWRVRALPTGEEEWQPLPAATAGGAAAGPETAVPRSRPPRSWPPDAAYSG